MKKTLKTLINTSMLMLFVSHSYGQVYNLPDVSHQGITPIPGVAGGANQTTLLDTNTHPGFNGIDDTFDGSIIFEFTITFDSYPANNNTNFALFALKNANDVAFSSSRISIGNFVNSDVWDANQGSLISDPFNFGNNQVVQGQSQSFTLTIDYNAGALDSATLIISGDSTTYGLPENNYSFDLIDFTSGFEGTSVSATNMSVSIVPEPATYALLSGALALVFVALRRRLKA